MISRALISLSLSLSVSLGLSQPVRSVPYLPRWRRASFEINLAKKLLVPTRD